MTQTSEREPRIELRAPQPYLGIARQVTNGVPAAVDDAFPALYEWLGENGVSPAGPPFIRTLEIDGQGEPLRLEVAAPVGERVSGGDVVRADALPAGPLPDVRARRALPQHQRPGPR